MRGQRGFGDAVFEDRSMTDLRPEYVAVPTCGLISERIHPSNSTRAPMVESLTTQRAWVVCDA